MTSIDLATRFKAVMIAELGSRGLVLVPTPSDEAFSRFAIGTEVKLSSVSHTSDEWMSQHADLLADSVVTSLRVYECQHIIAVDVTWSVTSSKPDTGMFVLNVELRNGEHTKAILKAMDHVARIRDNKSL